METERSNPRERGVFSQPLGKQFAQVIHIGAEDAQAGNALRLARHCPKGFDGILRIQRRQVIHLVLQLQNLLAADDGRHIHQQAANQDFAAVLCLRLLESLVTQRPNAAESLNLLQ